MAVAFSLAQILVGCDHRNEHAQSSLRGGSGDSSTKRSGGTVVRKIKANIRDDSMEDGVITRARAAAAASPVSTSNMSFFPLGFARRRNT
jgi:hypothetical protein